MDVSENYWSGSPLNRIKRIKCRPIKTLPVLSAPSTSATLVNLNYLDMVQSNNVLSGNVTLPLGLYVLNDVLIVTPGTQIDLQYCGIQLYYDVGVQFLGTGSNRTKISTSTADSPTDTDGEPLISIFPRVLVGQNNGFKNVDIVSTAVRKQLIRANLLYTEYSPGTDISGNKLVFDNVAMVYNATELGTTVHLNLVHIDFEITNSTFSGLAGITNQCYTGIGRCYGNYSNIMMNIPPSSNYYGNGLYSNGYSLQILNSQFISSTNTLTLVQVPSNTILMKGNTIQGTGKNTNLCLVTTIYGGQVFVAANVFKDTSCASTIVLYETDGAVQLQDNIFTSNAPTDKVIWMQFETKRGIIEASGNEFVGNNAPRTVSIELYNVGTVDAVWNNNTFNNPRSTSEVTITRDQAIVDTSSYNFESNYWGSDNLTYFLQRTVVSIESYLTSPPSTSNTIINCTVTYGVRVTNGCQYGICFGIVGILAESCGVHGACLPNGTCLCDQGYTNPRCNVLISSPTPSTSPTATVVPSSPPTSTYFSTNSMPPTTTKTPTTTQTPTPTTTKIPTTSAPTTAQMTTKTPTTTVLTTYAPTPTTNITYAPITHQDFTYFALGDNTNGQLGNLSSLVAAPFLTNVNGSSVVQVAIGPTHSLMLTANGRLYAMGNSSFGKMGIGLSNDSIYYTPIEANITAIGNRIISKIVAGQTTSSILTTDGKIYSAGTHNELMPTRQSNVFVQGTLDTSGEFGSRLIVDFAATTFMAVIGSNERYLYTVGSNEYYRLGLGVTYIPSRDYLSKVLESSGYASVSLGDSHGIGITLDGLVKTWGRGDSGQLGFYHEEVSKSAPTTPTDSINWRTNKIPIAVSAGFDFTLLLHSDGTAFATGNNAAGQLCSTMFTHISEFYEITSAWNSLNGKFVTKIGAGYDFSLFLTSDGHVYGCGGNSKGQLGLNSIVNVYTPTQMLITFPYQVVDVITSPLSQAAFLKVGTLPFVTTTTTAAPTPTSIPTNTKSHTTTSPPITDSPLTTSSPTTKTYPTSTPTSPTNDLQTTGLITTTIEPSPTTAPTLPTSASTSNPTQNPSTSTTTTDVIRTTTTTTASTSTFAPTKATSTRFIFQKDIFSNSSIILENFRLISGSANSLFVDQGTITSQFSTSEYRNTLLSRKAFNITSLQSFITFSVGQTSGTGNVIESWLHAQNDVYVMASLSTSNTLTIEYNFVGISGRAATKSVQCIVNAAVMYTIKLLLDLDSSLIRVDLISDTKLVCTLTTPMSQAPPKTTVTSTPFYMGFGQSNIIRQRSVHQTTELSIIVQSMGLQLPVGSNFVPTSDYTALYIGLGVLGAAIVGLIIVLIIILIIMSLGVVKAYKVGKGSEAPILVPFLELPLTEAVRVNISQDEFLERALETSMFQKQVVSYTEQVNDIKLFDAQLILERQVQYLCNVNVNAAYIKNGFIPFEFQILPSSIYPYFSYDAGPKYDIPTDIAPLEQLKQLCKCTMSTVRNYEGYMVPFLFKYIFDNRRLDSIGSTPMKDIFQCCVIKSDIVYNVVMLAQKDKQPHFFVVDKNGTLKPAWEKSTLATVEPQTVIVVQNNEEKITTFYGNEKCINKTIPFGQESDTNRERTVRELTTQLYNRHTNVMHARFAWIEGETATVIMTRTGSGADRFFKQEQVFNRTYCKNVLRILLAASSGLEFLHSKNIIHRDIKGANILVEIQNELPVQVKIADFGHSVVKSHTPIVEQNVGTKFYQAPETIGREQEYNEKVDVYSFGMVILEALYRDTLESALEEKEEKRFPSYTNKATGMVDALMSLHTRCIARDPNSRPSMDKVVIELEKCLIMYRWRKKKVKAVEAPLIENPVTEQPVIEKAQEPPQVAPLVIELPRVEITLNPTTPRRMLDRKMKPSIVSPTRSPTSKVLSSKSLKSIRSRPAEEINDEIVQAVEDEIYDETDQVAEQDAVIETANEVPHKEPQLEMITIEENEDIYYPDDEMYDEE
jgi:alpha-tubulin suppressor-like RCC1 family protein/serine/threonine protein kinase